LIAWDWATDTSIIEEIMIFTFHPFGGPPLQLPDLVECPASL
jgi:hypothetical protein